MREELRRKILVKEALKDYELEQLKLKIKKQLQRQKMIDEFFKGEVQEFLQGRDPADLDEDETKKYENLRDLYEKVSDQEG